MNKILDNLTNSAVNFLYDIIISLIILIIGFKLIAWLEKKIKSKSKLSKLDPSVNGFVISFVSISLKIFLIVIVLTIIGVPIASLITIVGSCAVAIGLALQGGLSNIAGGLMILIFKPFKVGDYILVNNLEGTVRLISMFYTTIETVDNKIIQLPNGNLSNSNIINYSANEKRRVDIDVSVSYDSDINKVKKIINNIIDEHNLILKNEEVIVRLKSHADSSLVFAVRVWVKTNDYWNVYYDLMELIKEDFDKNKISIPYPQLDVHLKNNK